MHYDLIYTGDCQGDTDTCGEHSNCFSTVIAELESCYIDPSSHAYTSQLILRRQKVRSWGETLLCML